LSKPPLKKVKRLPNLPRLRMTGSEKMTLYYQEKASPSSSREGEGKLIFEK
jgi:hypothetical protein